MYLPILIGDNWETFDKALLIKDREGAGNVMLTAWNSSLHTFLPMANSLRASTVLFLYIIAWAQAINCPVPLNPPGFPQAHKGPNAHTEFFLKKKTVLISACASELEAA